MASNKDPRSAPAGVYVVVNAHSGSGRDEAYRDQLIQLFRQRGVTARIELARTGNAIRHEVERAVEADERVVVVGGGDGTISTMVNALLGHDKTLGILPLGTLNHFAKDLGVPMELAAAVDVVCSGVEQKVDVGEVNGQVFVNNSSLGLYPHLVHRRERQQRLGHGKWPAFFWAAVAVLRRFPFSTVRLISEEKEFVSRTPLVFVGNNRYEMEGLNIGARRSLREGCLSVYVTRRTSRWGLFMLALRALFGRLRGAKDFVSLSTSEVEIKTRKQRLNVALDGEVMTMQSPLHYRVRAGELRVLVPGEPAAVES